MAEMEKLGPKYRVGLKIAKVCILSTICSPPHLLNLSTTVTCGNNEWLTSRIPDSIGYHALIKGHMQMTALLTG